MRFNTIKLNDTANSPGVAISIYLQGCPAPHCKGCFNPETWDFNGGKELNESIIRETLAHLNDNGIERSLCILGGEPLCEDNIPSAYLIVKIAKELFPSVKIYIWSRFLFEELKQQSLWNEQLKFILDNIYCLIDGPFIEEKKKLNMPMRGSTNQRVIYLHD